MADARFFRAAGRFTLRALASLADARLIGGDPDALITDVSPLERATRDQITFLDNTRYFDQARVTRAAACLIRPEHEGQLPADVARLLTPEPYHAYARVAAALHPDAAAPGPEHPPAAGAAAGALIDRAARLDPGCQVAAGAVIEAGAELGARCRVGANAVIGAGVRLVRGLRDRRRSDPQPLPDRRSGADPSWRADRSGRLRLRAGRRGPSQGAAARPGADR